MYCQKCGKEVEPSAKFCPNCGTQNAAGSQMEESDKPVLTLKPVFMPMATCLAIVPPTIFLLIWGVFFFTIMGKAMKIDSSLLYVVAFIPCSLICGASFLAYFSKKRSYEKTEYNFYNTKIEYYEGFLNVEEKTMIYKNITEVNLRKGIIQKKYGLGTMILSTPATNSNAKARSGISVRDIENPDEAYRQIKELIGKCS